MQILLTLGAHFMVLSLFAVGGGPSMVLPQMRQEFVLHYHFLTDRSFSELLAVAQATPGPNFLIVPLIGFRVASWAGAIVSIVAFLVVPVILTFFVGRLLHQSDNVWVTRARRGFRPATGGLWIVSGIIIAMATDHSVAALGITVGVTVCALIFDISPLWWCLLGGLVAAIVV